ncbi:uncharacterized protein LOC122512902 [Leptopilina heterotoma]|uniref:uncharacterized protein LOC122512902 n=1 Tax=Leptopilina heterotoma TaxID=63436 RepID=UPI001CA83E9E|nr:uncharacterized protein LOC122512902 [Leptopilina heterotoma]XP_043484973.1 uncharacterized protein LOC122512902 [Leptopilina heterotoma]
MKLIVVLGNIITITLVTLPIFKSITIFDDDRILEFLEEENLKLKIKNNYFNEGQILMLNDFVFNKEEIYKYAEYVNETLQKPKWIESHRLENPELYKLLRFSNYVESIPLKMDKMIKGLTKLQNEIFQNSLNVSILRTCQDYTKKNFCKLISLENYFAIQILGKNFNQVRKENPVGWRMRRALYSLALRQYNQNLDFNFSPIICYSRHLVDASVIYDKVEGEIFKTGNFSLCSSKKIHPEISSSSSIADLNNSTLYWTFYEYVITDRKLIVYLEKIIQRNNKKLYFFLPDVKLKIVNGPVVYNTIFGLVAFSKVKTVRIRETSKWLAKMANNIEKYEKEEIKYFNQYNRVKMMRV